MILATRVRIGEAISRHMPENSLNRYTFFAYRNYRHGPRACALGIYSAFTTTSTYVKTSGKAVILEL